MYLILHKVRGEPAFDVAEQLENGWWIIPTSGHRAYPHKTWPLSDLKQHDRYVADQIHVPPELPDHYSVNYESTLMSTAPRPQKLKPKSPTLDDLD